MNTAHRTMAMTIGSAKNRPKRSYADPTCVWRRTRRRVSLSGGNRKRPVCQMFRAAHLRDASNDSVRQIDVHESDEGKFRKCEDVRNRHARGRGRRNRRTCPSPGRNRRAWRLTERRLARTVRLNTSPVTFEVDAKVLLRAPVKFSNDSRMTRAVFIANASTSFVVSPPGVARRRVVRIRVKSVPNSDPRTNRTTL